jgi:hypothetical protein
MDTAGAALSRGGVERQDHLRALTKVPRKGLQAIRVVSDVAGSLIATAAKKTTKRPRCVAVVNADSAPMPEGTLGAATFAHVAVFNESFDNQRGIESKFASTHSYSSTQHTEGVGNGCSLSAPTINHAFVACGALGVRLNALSVSFLGSCALAITTS